MTTLLNPMGINVLAQPSIDRTALLKYVVRALVE